MTIEHMAYMVPDPRATAQWYVDHLGLRIVRAQDEEPFGHFLVDGSWKMMVEIYNNPAAEVLDYPSIDPLSLHLAFTVTDIEAERDRLVAAGATVATDIASNPVGDQVCMLREPTSGFAIQLVKRAKAMV